MTRSLPLLAALVAIAAPAWAAPKAATYPLEVLPCCNKAMTDPQTGARLTFLSTGPVRETDLYYHQRSFLSDDSMALYYSYPEGRQELMGYIFATGERVHIATPQGEVANATAARTGDRVYATRGLDMLELTLKIDASPDPAAHPSRVTCAERVITTVGGGISPSENLSENSNGRLIACGAGLPGGQPGIIAIDVRTGRVKIVCRIAPGQYHGHVQFSHVSPNLLSYAGDPRIEVVDTNTGEVRAPYHERPGELVTHESWWVGDQIIFCGGFRPGESDGKVLDPKTGVVRIVGAGAWWAEGTPSHLAKCSWWHASGHDSGRWVAADNWHGDIVVFDGKTTRCVPVTYGHRTYGHGEHPHVGWDRSGRRVIFTSNMLGVPHPCVAELPE